MAVSPIPDHCRLPHHTTPPPSAEASNINRFRHSPSLASPPSVKPPAIDPQPLFSEPSKMELFVVGTPVQVFCSGFGGTRWWTGTITKRVDSFDKKDCKLSIRFDDKRFRRPFVYKFSEYATAIDILELSPPSPGDVPCEKAAPLDSTSPEPIPGPVDLAGRQLRARKRVEYSNASTTRWA